MSDNYGVQRRRRFTLRDGALIAYNDEQLDDPDATDVAGGIPDPVLAEMGAARTGAMREIVATIQGEQDVIIRAPLDSCLIVQGGPGTGKTAVGLHRAAFLLFDHRIKLAREGVLVIGPNPVFLEYIGNVLPSLGERSVDQRTLAEVLVPRVEVTVSDPADVAIAKGSLAMVELLMGIARRSIRPPAQDVVAAAGVRQHRIEPAQWQQWIDAALAGTTPLNRRRQGYRALVGQELSRLLGVDDAIRRSPVLKSALDKSWPTLKPETLVATLRREAFGARPRDGYSTADAVLLDEAKGLVDGPVRTFGHVVVDEAQDLSPLAFRAVARRCPSRSLTILGDLAQSTAPDGQESWSDVLDLLDVSEHDARVEHLTIGYRVPGPILDYANRVLARAAVAVPASRSARLDGEPPTIVESADPVDAAVDAVRVMRRRHALSGIIAPARHIDAVRSALADRNLRAGARLHQLGPDEVPVVAAELAKGLELDGVVLLDPDAIDDGTPRGARLLYIALTRAVQELTIVRARP